jgi:thiol-disulfide isomerase/thioredoxin
MLSLLLLTAITTDPTLMVGHQAPQLTVKQWLKGEPIERFDKNKVYLVEFWATWCGPCLNGMKHLSELQEKYGKDGLVVVGVIAEDKWGNDLPNIDKTLKKHADKIGYRIALDKPTEKGYQNVFFGQTFWDFMGASQAQAIPVSYLVDRSGKITFIGLPSVSEEAIKEALAGTIDTESRAKTYAEYKASEGKLEVYFQLLKDGKEREAYTLARTLVEGPFRYEARMQWLIAEGIVDIFEKRTTRDLELAERCLTMALKSAGGTDVNMRGALACLHFHKGEKDSAIRLIKQVIEESVLPADKEWMQKRLAIMEKG